MRQDDPPHPRNKRQPASAAPDDGVVRISRERGNRRGKTVTVIRGLPERGVELEARAAELRRDARESIEDVSRFLDHSSLAVTTTYLRRLEGETDVYLAAGGGRAPGAMSRAALRRPGSR